MTDCLQKAHPRHGKAFRKRPYQQQILILVYLPEQGPGLLCISLTELYKTFIQYYDDSLLSAVLQKFPQIFPAQQLPCGIVGICKKQ